MASETLPDQSVCCGRPHAMAASGTFAPHYRQEKFLAQNLVQRHLIGQRHVLTGRWTRSDRAAIRSPFQPSTNRRSHAHLPSPPSPCLEQPAVLPRLFVDAHATRWFRRRGVGWSWLWGRPGWFGRSERRLPSGDRRNEQRWHIERRDVEWRFVERRRIERRCVERRRIERRIRFGRRIQRRLHADEHRARRRRRVHAQAHLRPQRLRQ